MQTTAIGARIREARVEAGLTITEVAKQTGLTVSHISQVERDVANPSIGALIRICDAIHLRPADLFFGDSADSDDTGSGGRDAASPDQGSISVIRHDRRKVLLLPGSTVRNEVLCPDLKRGMEAFWAYAEPGGDTGEIPFSHAGEEIAIVLKGTAEFNFGDQSYRVNAGDAIYFDARLPHEWKNAGDDELELIWVATPVHF